MLEKTVKLRNGIEMPIIGLGTSLRGKNTKVTSQEFVESVKHAIKYGYRHIDTAKCYNNEHLVGQAIQECEVNREDIFVVTKLYPDDMGFDKTLKAFEKSCKQLKVDYLDLFLIHFPGQPVDSKKAGQITSEKARELRLETWRAFEKLYNEGKCKAIGVSNYLKRHLDELVEANMSLPMVNQCEFHPYYNNKDLYETCKEMGIQFEGYSPLGKAKSLFEEPVVQSLASKYSKTPAQILLNWSILNQVVTIPGSTNHQRIEENFNVFDFKLDQEDQNILWNLNRNEKVSWDPTDVL